MNKMKFLQPNKSIIKRPDVMEIIAYLLYRWAQRMMPSVHRARLYFCAQS